jgi:hypothetical protein
MYRHRLRARDQVYGALRHQLDVLHPSAERGRDAHIRNAHDLHSVLLHKLADAEAEALAEVRGTITLARPGIVGLAREHEHVSVRARERHRRGREERGVRRALRDELACRRRRHEPRLHPVADEPIGNVQVRVGHDERVGARGVERARRVEENARLRLHLVAVRRLASEDGHAGRERDLEHALLVVVSACETGALRSLL